jgi:hypothetical protein
MTLEEYLAHAAAISRFWREYLELDELEAQAWRMFGYIVEQIHDERLIYQPPGTPTGRTPPPWLPTWHNLPRDPLAPAPFNPQRYRK